MSEEVYHKGPKQPVCDCGPDLDPLPVCEEDPRHAILCAVAHEQAEMAKMLKVLRCKLCKTVAWLPNHPKEFNTVTDRISSANLIEKDIAGIIKALADKESAIAKKVDATFNM